MPKRKVPPDNVLRPLVTVYFDEGLKYSEIALTLAEKHGIDVSLELIKLRLKKWGLQRKHDDIDLGLITKEELADLLACEIEGANRDSGYRNMTGVLRVKHQLIIKRDTVYKLMKEIDPDGIALRKKGKLIRRQFWSQGPNHTWSCDGHDKMKPYGITIYGWIDCWSRKILRLRAHATNNDPRHIAVDFLDLIEEFGGIPARTSTDGGTETVHMAAIQKAMHLYSTGNEPPDAHIWTTSPRNQRIECLWSQLMKRHNIRMLDELTLGIEAGVYNARDPFQKQVFQYIWIPLVQRILDEYVSQYNQYRQRANKNSTLPTGVTPNYAYDTPIVHDAEQCLLPIPVDEVDRVRSEYPADLFEYLEPDFKENVENAVEMLGIDIEGVTLTTAWETFTALWLYMQDNFVF